MTINEKLALMDEIARKNNAEWDKYKRQRRSTRHNGEPAPRRFHPFIEWLLKCLFTFCAVLLMGIVALMA